MKVLKEQYVEESQWQDVSGEEEVNVDTKQQSSNKVRTTEEEKKNRDIEERQRVFKYLFRILISQN